MNCSLSISRIAELGRCSQSARNDYPRNKEPLDKLTNYRNTTWFLALPESKKYYLPPSGYLIPHEIPVRYQGRQAILEPDKEKAKKLKTKAERERLNLPAGTADDNCNITAIQADLDNTLLTVNRNEYRTGTQKSICRRC